MDSNSDRRSSNSAPNSHTPARRRNEEDIQPSTSAANQTNFRIGHRANQNFTKRTERPPKSLGFNFLQSLLQNDSEKILLTLIQQRQGFAQALQKELTNDTLVLIVRILKKVSQSAFSDTKYSILHSSFNEKFVGKLTRFIACLPIQDSAQKRQSRFFWKDPDEFFKDLVAICEDILQTTPTFAFKTLPTLLKSLKTYIPVIEAEHAILISEEVKKRLHRVKEVVDCQVKELEEKEKKEGKDETCLEPPDDFRNISVYPTPEEIVGGRGFLRENVTKGPYKSIEDYLDVQFRLLREDFVGPLRDGIASFRSPDSSASPDNVRVHKDVKFLNTETINEFYCLRLQFAKKKNVNFEHSKRFMFGSLLVFTKDNFQNLIFGKVAKRDLKDLEKGQIVAAFDDREPVDFTSSYLMVECNVYFEPYFHVLTVLKKMTEENFPMERYFIRVNPSTQPPEYLTVPDCSYEIEGKTFNPLQTWPDEIFHNFNESQMTAFKAAITQEISVIQGPPGTGKTYLGLKLAETLLKNTDLWYDQTPMLVICYTNHALDQFLEGLIPVTKRLIRVGGQSKNVNLDEFNLRNKTQRVSEVACKKYEVQRCLRSIQSITEHLQEIDYFNSVVSFRNFAEVAPEFSGSWFANAKSAEVIRWLLEGATAGREWARSGRIQSIKVEEEIARIGINDEPAPQIEDEDVASELTSHIISSFDSIFDEIFDWGQITKSSFFLFTLSSMRDQLKRLQEMHLQLLQIENPTFQELIREEEIRFQLEELQAKYEYAKAHLKEGRKYQSLDKLENFNLRYPEFLNYEDRWRLYFYWLSLFKQNQSEELKKLREDFPLIYKEYEEMKEIEDVRTMKGALVVGMTTTSAARLRSSLQTLKNPIVIVEEAAEVLEAHIVTSITKHCKQLILIGDHKQLRPSTANYTMEKQYRLGISLFERLIINKIHCYTLNIQHRMRPEIACLIRPSIYDFLEDHPSVLKRPLVAGVDTNLFFVDHDHLEESEGSSKVNHHEVSFFIYLARHLVLNGHSPESITILTAYLGQFFAFQAEKKGHLDLLNGVRIAVLDNYQGEESDIILLSLVRSNEDGKIGFLGIENRVCVALSRARNGLYIVGNMSLLCSNNKLWQTIKDCLERQNSLGPDLTLRCQNHPDQISQVRSETDFYSISEGGCAKKCDMELNCGHKCTYLCHIQDKNHAKYKCQSICNKKLCNNDDHVCTKMCFEDCGPCNYSVERILKCGHQVKIPCHVDVDGYKCQVLGDTVLPCGHKTQKPCYCDVETFRCTEMCDVQVQPCGHACEMLCHFRRDPNHQEYQCKKQCDRFMRNCTQNQEEHRCKKKCYQKCDPCTITVRKQRSVCPHFYDVPCHQDVNDVDCQKPCRKKLPCNHTCQGKCNQPCPDCVRIVSKTIPICGHQVKVKCCDPPNRNLCTQKCPLRLPCGHPCGKRCNEPCTVDCEALVEFEGLEAECGHLVKKIECYLASNKSVDPKSLIKQCSQPCIIKLKCGHRCSGSCGECFQGRFHRRCNERCGARLVCDHECEFPCREACQPCKKTCLYRCQHSICKKPCGEECTPCRERCTRRCEHQSCRTLCGELCTVPPCDYPCPKNLLCGHPCVGFCGDPCPPKCMICHRDELLDVFFGTESEDSRFVLLLDCKHVVESEGMEHWLQQDEYQISYKLCPKCRTAIKKTQRYSDYTKKAVRDVAQVKRKTNGSPREIEGVQTEVEMTVKRLLTKCGPLNMYFDPMNEFLNQIRFRVMKNRKGRRPVANLQQVKSLAAKLQITQDILNICCQDKIVINSRKELFFPQLTLILNVLFRDIDYITNQEISDISCEIKRLSRIVEFSCLQKTPQYNAYSSNKPEAKQLIGDITKKIFDCRKFTDESNEVIKTCLEELNEVMKTGIAISDEERREILQAMGFSRGHWYKCPNGHVYAIGECGGAMEEASCIECGARVGGAGHRLRGDNALATEMDGARVDAWTARVRENYYRD